MARLHDLTAVAGNPYQEQSLLDRLSDLVEAFRRCVVEDASQQGVKKIVGEVTTAMVSLPDALVAEADARGGRVRELVDPEAAQDQREAAGP